MLIRRDRGFSFVELLVVTTIILILASAVQPLAKVTIQRTGTARHIEGDEYVAWNWFRPH